MENSWAQKGQLPDKKSPRYASLGTKALVFSQPLWLEVGVFMPVSAKFTSQAALYCNGDYFFLQGRASTLPSLEECVNNWPWRNESLFDTSRINTWNTAQRSRVSNRSPVSDWNESEAKGLISELLFTGVLPFASVAPSLCSWMLPTGTIEICSPQGPWPAVVVYQAWKASAFWMGLHCVGWGSVLKTGFIKQ